MERICRGLLQAGMDAQTPAAILQEGTSAAQRRVVATLSTLVERAQQEKIQAPAVLVIGKVCQLADQLSWTQLRPLDKVRVILTRPKELVSRMADRLYQLGAQVIELPSISLQPYEENEPLKTALEHLESYRWVAFTSIAGVRIFFEQLQKYRVDLRKLMHLRFAAIGPGTAEQLRKQGFYADLMPQEYYAADLGRALAQQMQPGERLLLPRAKMGSQELTDILQQQGIHCTDLPLYDTVYTSHNCDKVRQMIEENAISCAVFTSASTVEGFVRSMQDCPLRGLRALCIGEKTAQAARQAGMQVSVSKQATIDSLTELLLEQADSLRLQPADHE